MSLVAERLSWVKDFENGWEPYDQPRLNKKIIDTTLETFQNSWKSELWRSSHYTEKVCAYELWKRGEFE